MPKTPLLRFGAVIIGAIGRKTNTLKLCVAAILGIPLSAAISDIQLVEGDCAIRGRQLKSPLAESSCAFVGALGELQVNVWMGKSGSVAEFVTIKVSPAMMMRLVIPAMNVTVRRNRVASPVYRGAPRVERTGRVETSAGISRWDWAAGSWDRRFPASPWA